MFDIYELMKQAERLKTGREMVTNNFLTRPELERFSKDPDSRLLFNDKAITLFCKDNGVNRLYYHLSSGRDAAYLKNLISMLPDRPLIADCVGKLPYLDELERSLCDIGFERYVHMSRWRAGRVNHLSESRFSSMEKSGNFRLAMSADLEEIMKILYDTFDPFDAQLPTREFLQELIDDKLVFCATKNRQIIAVECLQRVGRNGIYAYLDAVIPQFRNSGMGIFIWQYALYHFRDCKNFTSWTNDKNTPANRMHEMLGYAYDGLHDYILIFR